MRNTYKYKTKPTNYKKEMAARHGKRTGIMWEILAYFGIVVMLMADIGPILTSMKYRVYLSLHFSGLFMWVCGLWVASGRIIRKSGRDE